MNIDTVRLGEDSKRRLATLKRRTGINQWNILGRWAFCTSIASGHLVKTVGAGAASGVEMTWKVFAGKNMKAYEALAKQTHFAAVETGFTGSLHDTVSGHICHGASLLISGRTSVANCASLLSISLDR